MEKFTSLNKIFYGAYCTGKTFKAILEALKITGSSLVNSDLSHSYTKDECIKIFEEFEAKRRNGTIEFVTFHESYSYDEFIECFNPYIKDNDKLSLEDSDNLVRDGLLKKIATEALFECIDIDQEKKDSLYNFNNFMSGFQALFPMGSTIDTFKGFFQVVRYLPQYIAIKPESSSAVIQLKHSVLREMLESTVLKGTGSKTKKTEPRQIKDILEEYKKESSYYYAIYSELKKLAHIIKIKLLGEFYKGNYQLKTKDEINNVQQYVLVIDEINHADVPKLFGETMSLIDDSNRGELSTTLLYSQRRFVLPQNLHIIGTLNTTDLVKKSFYKDLRHFLFVESAADSKLVADFGCGFANKFEVLNKKLMILLGKKYQIGHCYFLKSKYENADITVLKNIWVNTILPVLQVYFDGDWKKLQLLLGKAKSNNSFISELEYSHLLQDYVNENNSSYEFADLNADDCNFEEVLNYAFSE